MPPQDPRSQEPSFPTPVAPLPRSPGQSLESTPYDFIMSTGKGHPSHSGSLNLKGGPKLLYIAAGGAALVVILFIIVSLSGGKSASADYVSIAQQQGEIARVAGLDYDQLSDDSVQNFAINTELSLQTSQADFLEYLGKHGANVSDKLLAAGQNPKNDAQLSAAAANGNVDAAVHDLLVSLLGRYRQTLSRAYRTTHSTASKAELQGLYDQAGLLLDQAKS